MIRAKDVSGLYANKDRSLVISSGVLDVLCLLIRPCNHRIRLSYVYFKPSSTERVLMFVLLLS